MIIIISAIWVLGFAISYLMARTEIAADNEVFTTGTRLATIVFSLFSFAAVIIILVRGWNKMIAATGYWNKPVKETKVEEVKIQKSKPVLN